MNSTSNTIVRRQAGVHPALVDLAFVLAFLFLILSTLAETNPQTAEASELAMPPIELPELDSPSGTSAGVAEATATVSLAADGSLMVGETSVAGIDACAEALRSSAASSVYIRAESEVPYGRVAELLALCQRLGLEEVSLTYKNLTQTKDSQ
jgi:biopolymer transport protein ExbD